jgi:hypothetical protein
MKKLVLALALLPATALGADHTIVASEYTEVWRRANQVLIGQGLKITRSDREAGVLEGTRDEGAKDGWFTCPRADGAVRSLGYTVVVLLSTLEGKTSVRVTSFGTNHTYRNRYFLVFRKSPVNSQVRCESTGQLDSSILAEITSL